MRVSLCITFIAAAFTTALSCHNTSVEVKALPQPAPKIELAETYLRDIDNASKVINDNNLILNLTHLQAMDKGGKKYYLLEKETISYLLNSVTKNLYRDIILINWDGVIIYSMRDDGIFSKHIIDLTPPSPLVNPYKTAMEGSVFVSDCKTQECIIASPLDKDDKRWGVIVLIIKRDSRSADIAKKEKLDSSGD